MATPTIKIEKRNKRVSEIIDTIKRIIVRNGANKAGAFADLRDVIGEAYGVKLGYGGSHIWAANMKNERIFIIEGY
jgi:hypothetical protein